MPDFNYILVRYVPDLRRMEPQNVGIVLQGQGICRVMFDPNAARRDDVATDEFRAFKDVLIREVNGPDVMMFQPRRDSPEFLEALPNFASTHVRMSRPLKAMLGDGRTFEQVLEELMSSLVLKPGESPDPPETRPTGLFRRSEDAHKFVQRGLRKHTPVMASDAPLWTAYRQYNNGVDIVVDKVEGAGQLGTTAFQIDRASLISDRLKQFFDANDGKRDASYYLLADELKLPFKGQSQKEFDLMRKNLDVHLSQIRDQGGHVLRSTEEASKLVNDLDSKLPPA